jgi:cytochrome c556
MGFFPKGTSAADGVGKTRAKPVIWAKWGEFEAAAANLGKLASGLETAAATGDKAKIKAALTAMGKNGCGGCHKTFRAKKKKKKSS